MHFCDITLITNTYIDQQNAHKIIHNRHSIGIYTYVLQYVTLKILCWYSLMNILSEINLNEKCIILDNLYFLEELDFSRILFSLLSNF
jgi:hypothetical protein